MTDVRAVGVKIIRRLALPVAITMFASLSVPFLRDFVGKEVRLHQASRQLYVVEIPIDSISEIRPALAKDELGQAESFSGMVNRLKPYAAINGTFYSEDWTPVGDIVIDGKLQRPGRYPNAIAMRKDGKIEIIRRTGKSFDWSLYKCAIAAGPRLVEDGKIALDPIRDGFRKRALEIYASRSAVAITKNNTLLLVVCKDSVNLAGFAQMMLDLGAVDAINLDGGPACGLYSDGKIIVDAGLAMTNILVVNKR